MRGTALSRTAQGPVVVVGAGPVGLSAALFLRQQSVPVILLEASAALSTDMRASTFHPPTLDMLRSSGIAGKLVAQGTPVRKWQYRLHESGETIVFDLRCLADVTLHPFRLQCEQYRLTSAIVQSLAADSGFDLRMNSEVIDVEPQADTVLITFRTGSSISQLRTSFLIAADGSGSLIRRRLELPFPGDTYPSVSITLVLDCPLEDFCPDLLPVNYCWTKDDRFSLMRVGRHWRTGYSPKPGQTAAEALSDTNVAAHVRRITGRDTSFKVIHRAAYTVHKRALDSFRHGRVLFAGDSAHVNSPSGGMGMNSGIHDAFVLAASLGAVYRGASDCLLDSYAIQRRQVALQDVQTASDAHHRLHRESNPEERARRWQAIKSIANEPRLARDYLLKSSMIESLRRYGVHAGLDGTLTRSVATGPSDL